MAWSGAWPIGRTQRFIGWLPRVCIRLTGVVAWKTRWLTTTDIRRNALRLLAPYETVRPIGNLAQMLAQEIGGATKDTTRQFLAEISDEAARLPGHMRHTGETGCPSRKTVGRNKRSALRRMWTAGMLRSSCPITTVPRARGGVWTLRRFALTFVRRNALRLLRPTNCDWIEPVFRYRPFMPDRLLV